MNQVECVSALLSAHALALTIGLCVLASAGLARIALRRRKLTAQKEFVDEFRVALHRLMKQRGLDSFEWLMQRSSKMQMQLGVGGMMLYRPPGANAFIQNWEIVVNSLPEIRRGFSDGLLSKTGHAEDYFQFIDQALLRHVGVLAMRREQNTTKLLNPVRWLAEGFGLILFAPVWLLASAGVISEAQSETIRESALVRIGSGLLAVTGVAGLVVGLVVDWQPFLAAIGR